MSEARPLLREIECSYSEEEQRHHTQNKDAGGIIYRMFKKASGKAAASKRPRRTS